MNRPEPRLAAAALRLQCLGRLRLRDSDGTDISPRTRKARAVLAYLALTGQPVSRTRIADLLWSERGPDQARSSVRQAIFEVKRCAPPGRPVLITSRDEISLDSAAVVGDLAEIRRAAASGDAERLRELLAGSKPELLADLDDLDPVFDGWLRVERAREPSATLAIVLTAAVTCIEADRAGEARGIVAEVQRLDPCSEEAARLAMTIDRRLGDRSAIHRHFEVLRDRLRADYDAEPSRETRELFEQCAADEDRRVGSAPRPEPAAAAPPPPPLIAAGKRPWRAPLAVLFLGLLTLIGLAAWRGPPAPAAQLPLVAVLPFDQQGEMPPALAEGLWDDTRLALSQNRRVRVLGRTTSLSLDAQAPSAAALRRLAVDYVLEGGIRHQDGRVRIVASLTRARDGVGVWEKSFEGQLGDAMALQNAVAQGIEGRLRGRLAPGGGVHARQIVTTPRVYALYSEARALIRERGENQLKLAAVKLREAIRLDPHYAPALASLASTARIGRYSPEGMARDQAEAVASARRAIELAPNLAEAFAALALVEGEHLASSEYLLKRAIELDPSNGEAWNWLGIGYAKRGQQAQAKAAWKQGLEVDPYYSSPFTNLLATELRHGQVAAAEALIARLDRAGHDPDLLQTSRAAVLAARGDYSAAVAHLRRRATSSGRSQGAQIAQLGSTLLALGYTDETGRLWNQPPWFALVVRSEQLPPRTIDGKTVGPRDFWMTPHFGTCASRTLLTQGRADVVVRHYREGFRSRDDFVRTLQSVDSLTSAGTNLAVASRQTGNEAEAAALLREIERQLRSLMSRDPRNRVLHGELARVRAQQGARDEAIDLLVEARRLGWLPDGFRDALDLAREPSFGPLRGDPRFQAIRRQILAHVARERRELGPVTI